MGKTILTVWALLFTCAVSRPALATILDQLKEDFRATSGYIIMPAGDEYLIDQDATSGTRTGDLYTVVEKGEKIIHPVTQEVLGTLDEVKGLLQVVRVKTGYSYVRPIDETATLKRGEIVRRYDHVPTTFWDYTGKGEGFFGELKAALPALDWKPYADAQAGRPPVPSAEAAKGLPLVFLLRREGLTVHGPDFVAYKSYPPPLVIQEEEPQPQTPSPTSMIVAPAPAAQVPAPAGMATETPLASEVKQPAAGPVVYPEYQIVASLPETVLMADFVKTSQGVLLATTNGDRIQVFRLDNEQLTLMAQREPPVPGKILTLQWWQPTNKESLYLAVSMSVDENRAYSPFQEKTINGAIFTLRDSELVPVQTGLPYIIGAFDLDGDGGREILLGQSFDREKVFGLRIRQLTLRDGRLESDSFNLEVPWQFPVIGSVFADVTGDGTKEAIFVRNRVLFVYRGKDKIYESSRSLGGSVSIMNYSAYPGTSSELYISVAFEVSPLVDDLDGDGQKEIIAVGSTGSFFSAPGLGPGIDSAGLVVYRYQNGGFQKGALGDRQEYPIQGFSLTGEGFYLVVTQSPNLLGISGNSHLLRLPVSRP